MMNALKNSICNKGFVNDSYFLLLLERNFASYKRYQPQKLIVFTIEFVSKKKKDEFLIKRMKLFFIRERGCFFTNLSKSKKNTPPYIVRELWAHDILENK